MNSDNSLNQTNLDAEIGRLMLEAIKKHNAGDVEGAYKIAEEIQTLRKLCPNCRLWLPTSNLDLIYNLSTNRG